MSSVLKTTIETERERCRGGKRDREDVCFELHICSIVGQISKGKLAIETVTIRQTKNYKGTNK